MYEAGAMKGVRLHQLLDAGTPPQVFRLSEAELRIVFDSIDEGTRQEYGSCVDALRRKGVPEDSIKRLLAIAFPGFPGVEV